METPENTPKTRPDGGNGAEKWYRNSFRRCLVDMHIPDWDERFMASFDSAAYIDAMRTAGVDTAYFYANSCTGICNWPTKVGHQHNGLRGRDIVGEVTRGLRAAGIRPIVYINIWSKWAYEQHPDWRCVDQKGRGTLDYIWNQPGRYGECCMNSPYSDYVLALVDELCQNYDFDGFWVDMILWRMMCFCAHCRRRFKEETGQELPKVVDWQDPVWYAYLRKREAWNEEFFRRIIDRVKSYKPDATVMCNSSYYPTYFMGESLKFFRMGEFIGGDYSMDRLGHSFECSLFNSVSAHKPFEFLGSVMDPSLYEHSIIKSEEKLASLMFSTLAYNGRYGFIDAIDPTGTLNPRVYQRMRRIFEKERPYEKYLRPEVRFVRDVGLYTNPASGITPSQNGVPVVDANPSAPHMASTQHTALNLMDLHVPFAVLTPYDLDTLGQSKLLVLSDLAVVSPAEAEKLREFVREGGCLYASGGTGRWDEAGREVPGGALSDLLGVTFEGEAASKVTYIRPEPGHEALLDGYTAAHPLTLDGPQMRVRANPGTEVLGRLTLPWVDPADTTKFASAISDPPGRETDCVSLALSRYGKGRVIYAAGTLEALHKPDQAQTFLRLLRLLMQEPFSFETDAPHCVELTLYEQPEERRYILNLVNIQEKLPSVPVYNASVCIRVPQTVRRVRALPEEREIPFEREEDAVRFTADRIDIFRMFALVY